MHDQPRNAEHRGGTDSTLKQPQPHPSHTENIFHRRPKPLYTEKYKILRSVLRFSPYNTHKPLHYDLLPNNQQKHKITHAQITKHRGGTDSTLKRPQPHPLHTGGIHRRPKSVYTKKYKISRSVLRISPQHIFIISNFIISFILPIISYF